MIKDTIENNTYFVKGIIVDTNDPESKSRLKVRIPCYHGSSENEGIPDAELPWAQTCLQKSNAFSVGDTVWISFEGGDKSHPIIFGQLGSTAHFMEDTLGAGVFGGIVGGYYDIVIDGVTYHVGGSTLAEVGVSIITINEGGDYSAYTAHDVNGPSLGLMGFHAQALFDCLKKTRDKNSTQFDSICKSKGANSLISYIQNNDASFLGGGGDYGDVSIPQSSAIGSAMYDVMNSDAGKEVQMEEACRLVQNYIDMGVKAGVSDNGALLFLADISNQGPYMSICEQMRSSSNKSLDNFYNMSKNYYISGYDMYNRRTLTYKIIKELQSLGALNGTGGILEAGSNVDDKMFLQILKDTINEYVAKSDSDNWDYAPDYRKYYNIRGKNIEARTDCSGFIGAAMQVLSKESGGSYAHEVEPTWGAHFLTNNNISGFEKLTYSFSALKPGDIVARDSHVQAIASINPVKVYNVGGTGFASSQPQNWSEGQGSDVYEKIIRIKPMSDTWQWPVPSCKSISSDFGWRTLNGESDYHNGIDIPGAHGATIVAATSGIVVGAGESARNTDTPGESYICGGNGYGNCTIIKSASGHYTLYGHQSSILVKRGQQVTVGQAIGAIGNTGYSFGAHLHFGVYLSNGTLCDPNKFVSCK